MKRILLSLVFLLSTHAINSFNVKFINTLNRDIKILYPSYQLPSGINKWSQNGVLCQIDPQNEISLIDLFNELVSCDARLFFKFKDVEKNLQSTLIVDCHFDNNGKLTNFYRFKYITSGVDIFDIDTAPELDANQLNENQSDVRIDCDTNTIFITIRENYFHIFNGCEIVCNYCCMKCCGCSCTLL